MGKYDIIHFKKKKTPPLFSNNYTNNIISTALVNPFFGKKTQKNIPLFSNNYANTIISLLYSTAGPVLSQLDQLGVEKV
jgi:hypothetical protein